MPDGSSRQIYFALCGVKGDWPWLRVMPASDDLCFHFVVTRNWIQSASNFSQTCMCVCKESATG